MDSFRNRFSLGPSKYIIENPATSIERYKEESFSKYVPPREDLNKVMLAANGKEYDILQNILRSEMVQEVHTLLAKACVE